MRIAGLTFVQVTKIASLSFIVGACMELFMIKTGFYNIVTRKEAERRLEALNAEKERRERLKRLNVDISTLSTSTNTSTSATVRDVAGDVLRSEAPEAAKKE